MLQNIYITIIILLVISTMLTAHEGHKKKKSDAKPDTLTIVDGDTKLNILQEECQQLSIHPSEACAIGDGANDIQMLQAAGLGVGFQGKPLVRASTPYQINTTGLDTALIMMGIAV